MSITIYGPDYSTYVRTTLLTLEEKGLGYERVDVDILQGKHKEPDHLARNPFGPVPAFEHDGFRLYETDAIIRYLDRIAPEPPLTPTEPKAEARMNQAIGIVNSFAYKPMVWGIFVERVLNPQLGSATDEAAIADAKPKAALCLKELERLQAGAPFMAGSALSLADLFVYPVLTYLQAAPDGAELLQPHAGLRQWWTEMGQRPSVQKVIPADG